MSKTNHITTAKENVREIDNAVLNSESHNYLFGKAEQHVIDLKDFYKFLEEQITWHEDSIVKMETKEDEIEDALKIYQDAGFTEAKI